MNVIKLSSYRHKGESYYIIVDKISAVYRKKNTDYTDVYFGENTPFTAVETPEEIFKMASGVLGEVKVLIHDGIYSNKINVQVITPE